MERRRWAQDLADAEEAYELVRSRDPSNDNPQDLVERRDRLASELVEVLHSLAALDKRAEDRAALLGGLRDVWFEEVEARMDQASRLRALVPTTTTGSPYVEVTIHPFADTEPLCEEIIRRVDGRSVTDDDAREFGKAAAAATGDGELAVDVAARWIRSLSQGEDVPELSAMRSAPRSGIARAFPEKHVAALERIRLPDRAEVLLRRQDGTEVGTLDEGLSVGQRCTAVLALALATGESPILIDQPEDEIDNAFIYTELVPMLRSAKTSRQVLIATHNPNLPVNGDAELIYALQPEQVDDRVRGTVQVQGSLDRNDVRDAVATIMEGSREAFERRKVRYGF